MSDGGCTGYDRAMRWAPGRFIRHAATGLCALLFVGFIVLWIVSEFRRSELNRRSRETVRVADAAHTDVSGRSGVVYVDADTAIISGQGQFALYIRHSKWDPRGPVGERKSTTWHFFSCLPRPPSEWDEHDRSVVWGQVFGPVGSPVSYWGFQYSWTNYSGNYYRLFLAIPYWALTLLAALPLVLITVRCARRRRVLPGFCENCGYDLRASEGRCPECGRKIDV
jgi:hypothetical protein